MQFETDRRLKLARRIYYRLAKPPRWWHNRNFPTGATIRAQSPGGPRRLCVTFPGVGRAVVGSLAGGGPAGAKSTSVVAAGGPLNRHVTESIRPASVVRIVGSGPSIRTIRSPERLFERPTVMVNGAVSLAVRQDCGFEAYVVSDADFVYQKPNLFFEGVRRARVTVISPMVAFAAMKFAPDVFTRPDIDPEKILLREDIKRPFRSVAPRRKTFENAGFVRMDSEHFIGLSTDPTRGTFPGGTVIHDALQIVLASRPQTIEIYGMDLGDGSRFYRERQASPSYLSRSYQSHILPAMRLASEECRRRRVELLNASLTSRLPGSVIIRRDPNRLLDVPPPARRRRPTAAAGSVLASA